MKNYIMLSGLVILLLSTYLYVYSRGLEDGERNYKKSKYMALTLEAAYRYGILEGDSAQWINGYRTCNNFWKNKKVLNNN